MPLYNPTSAGTVADGSITSAKILDGTIAIADLSATGTPSASTYLRGDDTWAAIATGGLGLTPTAVKTSGYTAAAGDLVPVDTTSAGVTVTLPTAPADATAIAVQHAIQGSTNAVTIARGGSDVFRKASGATSLTLALASQGVILQYKASTAVWYVVAETVPLATTDARYAQVSNNLSDVTAASARTNLGLGTAATISATAGGDLSGTLPSPTVAKVNGIAVSGTPAVGNILAATGTTAATWQAYGPAMKVSTGWKTTVPVDSTFNAPTQSALYCTPIMVWESETWDTVGVRVSATAASSTVRLGVYADNGSGYPGSLVADFGTIDSATSTGDKTISISQALTAGLYWLAAVSQGGAPSVRGIGNTPELLHYYIGSAPFNFGVACAWTQSSVTGALPAFSAGNSVTGGNPHRVFVRCV